MITLPTSSGLAVPTTGVLVVSSGSKSDEVIVIALECLLLTFAWTGEEGSLSSVTVAQPAGEVWRSLC